MHLENLKKWLDGKYVSPLEFKESLSYIVAEYEKTTNVACKVEIEEY